MKRLIFVLVLYLGFLSEIQVKSEFVSHMFEIREIIEKHYVKNSINFNILAFGQSKLYFDALITYITRNLDSKVSIGITQAPILPDGPILIEDSSILIFDSLKTHLEFNNKASLINKYSKRLNFLVIYATPPTKISINIWKDILQYQTILFTNSKESRLYVILKYSERYCNSPQIFEINRFSTESLTWKMPDFFPPVSDFHKCKISVGFLDRRQPFSEWKVLDNGPLTYEGLGFDILGVLSKSLNFEILLNFRSTITGEYFYPFKPDLFQIFAGFQELRFANSILFLSESIDSDDFTFIIPRGEPYTPFEKLYLPFDEETWMWFCIFMVIGIATIFVLRFLPTRFQQFVIGERVR